MNKKLSNFIITVLIIMILSILLIAIFWIPQAVSYISLNVYYYFSNIFTTNDMIAIKTLFYCAIYIIIAIALVIFSLAFKFPIAIKNNTIFSKNIASLLKTISILTIIDCIIFSIGIIILYISKEYFLSPPLTFFNIIGYTISFMLFTLSKYVSEASILKEEAEYTLWLLSI